MILAPKNISMPTTDGLMVSCCCEWHNQHNGVEKQNGSVCGYGVYQTLYTARMDETSATKTYSSPLTKHMSTSSLYLNLYWSKRC